MTPIGHTATGYLAAYAALGIVKPPLPEPQINSLISWGIFWAVIVDWDLIISFIIGKSLKLSEKVSHRRFPSHTPFLWLIVSLAAYLFASSTYAHYFALVMFVGSWSHMIFDSIEYGAMWLWPFSKKLYALRDGPNIKVSRDGSLIEFYWNMFCEINMKTLTFRFEVLGVVTALILFLLQR